MTKNIKKIGKVATKPNGDQAENPEEVIHRQCQELDAWREKYQELQKKFDDQLECTSRLVKDCDVWRDKYRELKAEYDKLVEPGTLQHTLEGYRQECEELHSKNSTLEMSNKGMEDELNRVRAQCDKLSTKFSELTADNKRMHTQSLWERIFNR